MGLGRRGSSAGYGQDRMPSRRGGLLVPVFLGLIVLALVTGVGLWFLGRKGDSKPAAATTVTVEAQPSTSTAPSSRTGSIPAAPSAGAMTAEQAADAPCVTPPGDAAAVTAPPSGATWELIEERWVPTTDAGPTVKSGGVRRCYAHTPEGAVMAMYSVPYFAGASQDAPLIQRVSVTSGPMLDQMRELSLRTGPRSAVQTVAFRTVSYSPQAARFELVQENRGRQWRVQTQMVWDTGDWKMDGSFIPPEHRTDAIADPTGWVMWRGPEQ